MKTKRIYTKELEQGDYVLFKSGDIGIVIKRNKTYLHKHFYTLIAWIEINYNDKYNNNDRKYYDHENKKINVIIERIKK